ncbi:IMPACT family protein [Vogesella oryzae]|uniref:IMPACT family protein n=1 Tax=Vogesella oryzae TaxID=1735285 RepID=UPI001582E9E2|nr:YigZ family protein [Vogesella oryzae]
MSFTLQHAGHAELDIKKSRFLACVEPVADRSAALQRVAELKAAHPAAAHVCWALLAGGHSAANDDGEPSGTAGRPMLEVLRHQALEGVLATVVRYYGGVKLGAGGLVRAYTDSVARALDGIPRTELQRLQTLRCQLPYALEGHARRLLQKHAANLEQVAHDAQVTLLFSLPEREAAALCLALEESSHGQLQWLAVPTED